MKAAETTLAQLEASGLEYPVGPTAMLSAVRWLQTQPLRAWRSLDEAMADPLFQQCRGIMGTASYGQDDALFRAIRHFAASGVTGTQGDKA